MKKILIALLVVILIIAGAAFWFWRGLGTSDYATLLPADTVLAISLNDLPRSALRWPQTTLAKIGAEPQVTEFLKKPLQYMSKDRGGDEATSLLMGLKPVRIFGAVVKLTSQENSALVGFQFWGGGSDYNTAIARLRQELDRGQPSPSPVNTEDHHGDTISISSHGALTLYTARHGHWGFLSNNNATIKQALDRASGRDQSSSLAASPVYKKTFDRLVSAPDVTVFSQPQAALDTLLAVGASMGAQAIPSQVDQLRKIEAFGMNLKCDGANLHDSIFILRQNTPPVEKLSHQSVKFTTPDTTIYFNFLLDLPQIFATGTANPMAASFLRSPLLVNSKLPALVPEAFGPECAVSLTWGQYDFKPRGVAALQVRDPAKAEDALREFLLLFPQAMITERDGVKMYNFPSLQGVLANPTFAFVDGFLLVGMDGSDIEQAVKATREPGTIEQAPDFSYASSEYSTANEVFGYVDSKKIVTRGYPMLRQVMIFGVAVMPGTLDMIDASKLPDTETITKHLSPIVYSQTRYQDGYLIESKGPITMNQAILVGAGAAFPFLKPAGL